MKNQDKKINEKDVGYFDDLIFALKNSVSAEEHSAKTFGKTQKDSWAEIWNELRKMRSEILYSLLPESEEHEESYCIVKHLLGESMGYQEVASRELIYGNKEKAIKYLKISELCESLIKLIFLNKGKIK